MYICQGPCKRQVGPRLESIRVTTVKRETRLNKLGRMAHQIVKELVVCMTCAANHKHVRIITLDEQRGQVPIQTTHLTGKDLAAHFNG